MKIENNSARLITLNCFGRKPLNLSPGVHDVDDKHWADLKKAFGGKGDKATGVKPGFLFSLLKSRDLIEGVIGEEDGSDDDKPKGVTGNAQDAIATVRLCEDLDQLEEWQAGEERKTVLAAIDEQISDLASDGDDED